MGKFGIPAKHHEAIALIYAKVRVTSKKQMIELLHSFALRKKEGS